MGKIIWWAALFFMMQIVAKWYGHVAAFLGGWCGLVRMLWRGLKSGLMKWDVFLRRKAS